MKNEEKEFIKIFTDGSSRGNPGPGGCAAILKYRNHQKEISKGYRLSTNNRMELMAVILGLSELKIHNCNVIIYSDSKYFVNAILNNWLNDWIKINFKKKKNKDLWLKIYSLFNNHNITVNWVKGHNGNIYNEKCDKLAVQAAKNHNLEIDKEYEKSI